MLIPIYVNEKQIRILKQLINDENDYIGYAFEKLKDYDQNGLVAYRKELWEVFKQLEA